MQLEPRMESRPRASLGEDAQAPIAPWTGATRIAFRFAFVYFGLCNSELALHVLPFPPFAQLEPLYMGLRWRLVVWVSGQLLHLSHDFSTDFQNVARASKDTTYIWVQTLCYLVIAVVATLVWSWADRKRLEYTWLHKWFLVYLRVCLAAGLISFGVVKLLPVQFAPPPPSELARTIGSLRREQLLWVSMGVSPIYCFFGGLMEVVPAFLLLLPGVVTLGALLSIASMTNVLMLNFGYDIGAKSMSINMLLMAVLIVLPDAARLADFFLPNRSVPANHPRALFRQAWLNRAATALLVLFGVVLFNYTFFRSYQEITGRLSAENTNLYGTWFVDDYAVSGESKPPLSTSTHRWQRLFIDSKHDAVVEVMSGDFQPLFLRIDPHAHSLVLTESGGPEWIAELMYDDSKPGSLLLRGTMGGLPVMIQLHREDQSKFPVNDHKITWVRDANSK